MVKPNVKSSLRKIGGFTVLVMVLLLVSAVVLPGFASAADAKNSVVAADQSTSFVLKSDGTVWKLGKNSHSKIDLSDAKSVAAGTNFNMVLKEDGTVWAWGYNDKGQLGDGTTIDKKDNPVQVKNLTGVVAIAAGFDHAIALTADGKVYTWGSNFQGQLGIGSSNIEYSNTPVYIMSGVKAVSAGNFHCLAVKNDGTVWSWGDNSMGQIGCGSTNQRFYEPVRVSSLSSVVGVSGGKSYSLALKSDGTVYAWGANYRGNLGDGTTTHRRTPVQVSNLTGVTAISAGGWHSLALKSDGTVWAWGMNDYGQLGDGTNTERRTPVQVRRENGKLAGIKGIAAGWYHSLAYDQFGRIWAWGENEYGCLGDGTYIDRNLATRAKNINQLVTLESYNGTGILAEVWGTPEKSYDISNPTVYLNGTGFPVDFLYRVVYYDSNGSKVVFELTEPYKGALEGVLESNISITGYPNAAVISSKPWYAVVYPWDDSGTFPDTLNLSDPNIITEDEFYVSESIFESVSRFCR